MKSFRQYFLEDIEVTDRTGNALNVAKEYIKTYKSTKRPVPKIIEKGYGKFILKGPDEKFVADMLSDKKAPLGALKNVNVKTKKVR